MRGPDARLRETALGLGGSGASQRAYLGYLAIQALVVLAWWPKGGLDGALRDGGAPDTLLAALLACGAATAYHATRAGAEELLLPGQHGLRDWLHATALAPWRIVRGHVAGQLLQSLHAVALSSPLLLAAFAVSGGTWTVLGQALAGLVLHATCYGLAAAVVYLFVGHRGDLAFWTVRLLLLAGYATTAAALPAASHVVATARLLDASRRGAPDEALAVTLVFSLACGALVLVLALALVAGLGRERARAAC